MERGSRSSNALLTKHEDSNLRQALIAKRELACRLHKDKMAAMLATVENEKKREGLTANQLTEFAASVAPLAKPV